MTQLHHYTGFVGQMSAAWRAAHLDLLADQFLKNTYPTQEVFAAAHQLTPHTQACAARWEEMRAQARATTATTIADDQGVSMIAAQTGTGALVGLTACLVVWGSSAAMVAATIGSATSTLPTHRLLQSFRYPAEVGFDAATTPETALAEFGRVATRSADDLRDLLHVGALTLDQVSFIAWHGRDIVLAAVYEFARWQPQRVVAFVFNTRYRLARAFQRRGLPLVPLFHDGAEPTLRMRQGGNFNAAWFQRWADELDEVVPAEASAAGIAASVRWLVEHDFAEWDTLSISLPYLFVNDEQLASAMARLAQSAARCPEGLAVVSPLEEARKLAVA